MYQPIPSLTIPRKMFWQISHPLGTKQRRAIIMLGLLLHFNWFSLANFEIFTGASPILLKQYQSSTHQFDFKMVASSVIPPQERKSFNLFLFKHLNVDLKIGLFLLQWIWFYFLLKSTKIFKQFSRVPHC